MMDVVLGASRRRANRTQLVEDDGHHRFGG